MKTSEALLEYLVPGILLGSALTWSLLECIAGPGFDFDSFLSRLDGMSRANLSALGALFLSTSYVLGIFSSNLGGRLMRKGAGKALWSAFKAGLPQLENAGYAELRRIDTGKLSANLVRDEAGFIRAYCRIASEEAGKDIAQLSGQVRILRSSVLAFSAVFITLALHCLVSARSWSDPILMLVPVLLAIGGAVAWFQADSYFYRLKLLTTSSLNYFAAIRAREADTSPAAVAAMRPAGAAEAREVPIVATDSRDLETYRADMHQVHAKGLIHRAVHIEIEDKQGRFLVWRRRDGRYEIPGGHLNWLVEPNCPETYRAGALREIYEELDLARNWGVAEQEAYRRLDPYMETLGKSMNQQPSSYGRNFEWVEVFRLRWIGNGWGDPSKFAPSSEGNHSPSWLSISEIESLATSEQVGINSALRMFLGRRNFLAGN